MKKRPMTLEESVYELKKAWREFCFDFLKLLGIIRLLNWLKKKLEERRK